MPKLKKQQGCYECAGDFRFGTQVPQHLWQFQQNRKTNTNIKNALTANIATTAMPEAAKATLAASVWPHRPPNTRKIAKAGSRSDPRKKALLGCASKTPF